MRNRLLIFHPYFYFSIMIRLLGMHINHTNEKYPNFLGAGRRLKGLRYKQVARKLRKSTKVVALWEQGKIMPGGKNLIALSLLYNKSFRELYPDLVETLEVQLFHEKK
jgi:transcriptional regulator with XRE-family HTH domain